YQENNFHPTQFHLLTFEELTAMPDTAFDLMLELVDVRYEGVISNLLGKKDSSFITDATTREKIRKSMGMLEMTISQYNKIRKEIIKNTGDGKSYSLLSIWKLNTSLFENLCQLRSS